MVNDDTIKHVLVNLTINPCFEYLHVNRQPCADMKKEET